MRHFLIVGVEHSEPRNTPELLERVNGPCSAVYHETPENQGSYWGLLWLLVAPAQAANLFLNSTSTPTIKTECQRAASELADEMGLNSFVPIDQPYRERVLQRPLTDILMELLIPILFTGLLLSGSLTVGYLLLGGLVFPLLGKFDDRREIPRRDKWMVRSILGHSPNSDGKEIIVVGEDHVAGIGGRLQERGHSVEALWLNSVLTEKDSQ